MVNGVGWDALNNGTMIKAAFEVYNGSAAFNGYMLGMLYLILQALLWYKIKKPLPGLIIGLMFLSMYFSYNAVSGFGLVNTDAIYVTSTFLGIISGIALIQLGAWFVSMWLK